MIHLAGVKCASNILFVVVVVMWSKFKMKDPQKNYENMLIGFRQNKGMLPPQYILKFDQECGYSSSFHISRLNLINKCE